MIGFVRILIGCSACVLLLTAADAADNKAYKYVDEKGNVTYSQVPPATGKDASKIDISPASGARSSTGAHYARPYPGTSAYSERPDYAAAQREQMRQREEAQQKRMRDLEAECVRARGTDCKNPDTLRYIESQNVPRTTVRAR